MRRDLDVNAEDRCNNKWSLVQVNIQDSEKGAEQQDKSLRDMTRQTPAFLSHGNCCISVRLRLWYSVMQ